MPAPPPPPRRDTSNKASAASKEENIYIPSFISKRPFYAVDNSSEGADASTDYLEHQRLQKSSADDSSASKWYDRGRTAGPAATRFRKGACENCGAMGHQRKDCLERPRKKGAKFTGLDIKADRVEQDVRLGWDAKRDRWNGYDPREYRNVVERYKQMDGLRSKLQQGGGRSGNSKPGEDGEVDDEDDDDEEARKDKGEKYAEESDMGRHQSTATRQLRIREDTAKYLLNLDLESAKYDPKTRTMVDAGATNDKAAQLFAEEGFLRASGDAAAFEKASRYAWEAQEKRGDTSQHIQANPTAGEFYRKKEADEVDKQRAERQKALLDRYGADDADQKNSKITAAMRDMAVTQSEAFVEYDELGLVKGAPRAKAVSKYKEDVLVNNHGSVWGSWWENFRWGYACCRSFVRNSYCTGEEGARAWEAAEKQKNGMALLEDAPRETDGDRDASLGEAARKEREQEPEEMEAPREPPREPPPAKAKQQRTEEEKMQDELEEYRRTRTAGNDPMAKFLGKDELVS